MNEKMSNSFKSTPDYTYDTYMPAVKKTITISADQAKWITDNSINLSKLVQKCINNCIEKGIRWL